MPRRFQIKTKSEPNRLLADGVVFWGGRVAVFDYRYELVVAFSSIESALRDHQQGVEVEWIDATEAT